MSQRKHHSYRWFIAPALAVLGLLLVVPVGILLYTSLTSFELGQSWDNVKFTGIENYIRILSGQDRLFWKSVRLTLVYGITVPTVSLVVGFLIALTVNSVRRFRPFIIACLIVPMSTAPSITGLIWRLMFNDNFGIINYLLSFIRVTPDWLGPQLALTSVTAVSIWMATPFMALTTYAGLQSVPQEPLEAALVDGASPLQTLRWVTVPFLRPVLLMAYLLQLTSSLQSFGQVFILTGGGPGGRTNLLALHILQTGFRTTTWVGRAAAVAVVLLIVTLVLSMLITKFQKFAMEGQ